MTIITVARSNITNEDRTMTTPSAKAMEKAREFLFAFGRGVTADDASEPWSIGYQIAVALDALAAEASADLKERVIKEVAAERRRQVESEGWSAEHDDMHSRGEMAQAAACYAMSHVPYLLDGSSEPLPLWPWEPTWWKPKGRRRDLIRAGALIVAEIERIDRAAIRKQP